MTFSRRDMILLAVLGVLALVGGGWWLVVRPAAADLSAGRERLEEVRTESGALRDTLSRLGGDAGEDVARTAERLRLAAALPGSAQTPGVVVQMERLADRAGVELTSVATLGAEDHGEVRATEYEIAVTGPFLDVDDFMYRMHRQVAVDDEDRPIVGGRLLATRSVDIAPAGAPGRGAVDPAGDDDVVATLTVLAFSDAGGAAPGGSAPGGPPAGGPGGAGETPGGEAG